MIIPPPQPTEYAPYYGTYINHVNSTDLIEALQKNETLFAAFAKALPAQLADYRYAEGKWTVKEVIIHLTDAERIFAYRALRFARNDKTGLAGFDENTYVPETYAAQRSLSDIIEEWQSVRAATLTLFKSFSPQVALRTGSASGKEISVRALGYIIVGHTMHHMGVIAERYLGD